MFGADSLAGNRLVTFSVPGLRLEDLHHPLAYLLSKGVADIVTTVAVVYLLGARSLMALVLATAIAYFLVSVADWTIFRKLFPPKLRFCGDYRDSLYDRDRQTPSRDALRDRDEP